MQLMIFKVLLLGAWIGTLPDISSAVSLPDISEFFASLTSLVSDHKEDVAEVNIEDKVREKRQLNQDIGDSSSQIHIAESSVLPTIGDKVNLRYMPTLSNGHIGFTPYSGSIFVNGLYNGAGGESHRAIVPAVTMGRIHLDIAPGEQSKWQLNRKYSLNAETGVFMEEIDSNYMFIQHRMYVHQKYTRLFISDFYARAKKHHLASGGIAKINYTSGTTSEDIQGFQPFSFNSDKVMDGFTKQAEVGTDKQPVSVFWTPPIQELNVRGIGKTINETFVMAIDTFKANAQEEFKVALRILFEDSDRGPMKLLREHEDAWRKTWYRGKLEVEGEDMTLKKIVQFSQYYLLSNMPAYDPYLPRARTDFLYGAGRQSLSKGSKGKNQQGHIFWDSEVYILPALLPLHPNLAKEILRYRSQQLQSAIEYAKQSGDQGARYPWESAYSGFDVTPPGTCDGCKDRQIHVGASIAWAIRQFYSLTMDRDYLKSPEYEGCDVMKGIADYYANKAVFDQTDGRYHIDDVMGPDDYHDRQNNDAYTNAVISLAIHYARYMACQCSRPEREEIPDEYIQKALYLKLPFDNVKKVHYQSDLYEQDQNKTVKQASVVLLGYPLNWNMSRDIQKNDLELYEQLTDPRTPAMTKSFMTIGWKFINDKAKTLSFFQDSYQQYVVQPFKIWTEYQESSLAPGEESTVNFLPGMGGFLQSIIYGFAGLRIRPEMVEFHNPFPPQGLSLIRLRGFHYLEANMTITIEDGPRRVTVEVHSTGQYPLVLVRNDTYGRGPEESINAGSVITITNPERGFYIYSTKGTGCDHPRDYIFMPWGYSPWIDDSNRLTYSLYLLLILCIVTLLVNNNLLVL